MKVTYRQYKTSLREIAVVSRAGGSRFLAAQSNSKSLVVCPSVPLSVRPSVHLCEKVAFRVSNGK